MPITDQQIGANVRARRGRRPQESVAVSMRVLGHESWRPKTLSLIENGRQSLKMREAVTLASILGCSLDDLVKEKD